MVLRYYSTIITAVAIDNYTKHNINLTNDNTSFMENLKHV